MQNRQFMFGAMLGYACLVVGVVASGCTGKVSADDAVDQLEDESNEVAVIAIPMADAGDSDGDEESALTATELATDDSNGEDSADAEEAASDESEPAADEADAIDADDEEPATADDSAENGAEAAPVACLQARQLWSEDFETGDYSRWTSNGYVSTLNQGGCFESTFSKDQARSGESSHRTSIACASGSNHRIYGGLQFAGDSVMPQFTNRGVGVDAPNGIVVTYWSWLDAPGFGNGRWFNFFTTNNACDYTDEVVTFGLEDPSNQVVPAHIVSTGGTLENAAERAAFPFQQWSRTTVYLNYYTGQLHVWQDGVSQVHGTFRRNSQQICQFHWGLYANGSNTHITLFEDDMSVWKLDEPLTDFEAEPWLGETQPVCEQAE